MVSRDFTEWANGLRPHEREELDKVLIAKCGVGLRDRNKETQREIARILRRGHIKDEDEYWVLVAYLDQMYTDESKRAEVEKINSVMAAFEKTIS